MSQGKQKQASMSELQKQIEDLKAMIASNNTAASQSEKPPLSYKPTPQADNTSTLGMNDAYQNRFDLPEALKLEMSSKGYNYKFINFTTYKKDTVHRAQWVPYKPEIKTSLDMVFGKSPEGYIVRGDCVLAVRPLIVDKAFKDRIRAKTNALLGHNEKVKGELQQLAKEHGVKKSHIVGDDDSDE